MGFLENIWAWISGIIGRVIAKIINYIWDWVERKFIEKWHDLRHESEPFKKAFALGLFRKKCNDEESNLRSQLSSDQQGKLRDFIDEA